MASTASPSLRLQLMATGDQSGTWGDTTNTNLGTLLEQAITGYQAIAKVGTTDYTLSNTDYVANENRNAIIEFTGTPGGAFNVIVPLAEKLWVFKNSTNGAMTVKGATGTGVTVAVSTSRWLYCDGTNVLDALTGTMSTQTASNVAITGGTITGLTSLTLASGAATPATNDAAALGTGALSWSDLFLASGGVINFANGDVLLTHSANTLAFTGASSGYTFDAAVRPSANDGAALGSATVSWADLFLATGGVINFANGNYTLTHSAGLLTASGPLSLGVSNALTAGSIELGNASDTTITRVSAGLIAVEGKNVALEGNSVSFANVTATTAGIMGSGDGTGTVVGGTLRAPARTGLDAAGVNLTIAAGNGTGTGGSGSISFQTAPAAASSSTANTLAEKMRITNTGTVQPGANDGGALGSGTVAWSDLFLAAGGVINFDNGDITITEGTNTLAFAGASSGYTFDAFVSPAANDGAALGSATVSWADLFLATGGVINWANGDITVTGSTNALAFAGASSGYTFDAFVSPATNDGAALGSATVSWADLFLATGGVINFANGDVLITHSTNTLAFTGASSGYSFDAVVKPSANDSAALGAAGTAWSDLFLASGGVINFDSGDVTITEGANTLTFAGAASGYTFSDGGVVLGAPTGGSQGAGTVNATGFFKNGNDTTTGTITYVIDGGGSTITTGIKGDLTIPFACTINEWTLLADQSGSIVVDIWKDTYANYPPTGADAITASAKPTISAATKGQSSTLTGWTTSITAGDTLRFNVDSITTCQRVTLSLKVTRA